MTANNEYSPKAKKGSKFLSKDTCLRISFLFNIILVFTVLQSNNNSNNSLLTATVPSEASTKMLLLNGVEKTWHGGHPTTSDHKGSCWCGADDGYCMCTPNLAIDLILVSHESPNQVWVVRRKDTSQLATMGGFVDVGETVEEAVHRELKEEMGISLESQENLKLQGIYSDPKRDNRRHTASAVYAVQLKEQIHPKAADDAKEVVQISLSDIETLDFFADHKTILLDYRQSLQEGGPATMKTIQMHHIDELDDSVELRSALMVQRSVCSVRKKL